MDVRKLLGPLGWLDFRHLRSSVALAIGMAWMGLACRPYEAKHPSVSTDSSVASAQDRPREPEATTPDLEARLSDAIPRWMADNHVPAVAVGFVLDGEIAFCRVFGERHPGAPADEQTIFNIASLTKPVVALMTLGLVAGGELSLDEPLASYWVDPRVRDDPRHLELTARRVLSHQTGFPNWGGRDHLQFESDPGTRYGYSGEGFEYLKEALERKFGQTLEQMSEQRLFGPLDMRKTRYTWDEALHASRLAHWFDSAGAPYEAEWKSTDAHAADDLLTTIGDYAKFAKHVARGGGLPPHLFAEMSKSYTAVNERVGSGLGWRVISGLPHDEFALVHGGGDPGVRTRVIVLPHSKRAIVVFTNADRGDVVLYNIVREALDEGHQIMDALDLVPEPLDHSRVVKIEAHVLDSYSGTYRDDDTIEIRRHEDRLRLRVKEPLGQRVYLLPLGFDRFFADGEAFEVVFEKDELGQVVGFTAYEGSQRAFAYSRIAE